MGLVAAVGVRDAVDDTPEVEAGSDRLGCHRRGVTTSAAGACAGFLATDDDDDDDDDDG